MRRSVCITFAISSLILSACGGGGSSSAPAAAPNPPSPPVNRIPVASDTSIKTNMDESLDAALSAQDADGDA